MDINPKKPDEQKKSDVYLIHKLSKQAAARAFWTAASPDRILGTYSVNLSLYRTNPNDEMFRDRGAFIYRDDNRIGKTLNRLLGKDRQPAELSARGHSNLAQGALIRQIGDFIRLSGDGLAVTYCGAGKGRCAIDEAGIAGMDATTAGATFLFAGYNHKGTKLVGMAERAEGAMANTLWHEGSRALRISTRFMIGAFGINIVTGISKMAKEVYNYSVSPENVKLSAFVDGAVDAGTGGAYFTYGRFLLKEFAKVLAQTGNIERAAKILSASAWAIPARLLWTMRGFGMVGGAIGFFKNAEAVYDGLTSYELPEEQRDHLVISGSLGAAASLAFMGSAFFITPATIPIGVTLFLAGGALLIIQTIYDEWDNIMALLPLARPFQYHFPAQQDPSLIYVSKQMPSRPSRRT